MNRVEELLGEGLLESERDEVLTTLLTSTKNLIVTLAAEAKLNVVEGTSFGFDYTRLALYSEPSSLYRPNFSQGYSQREYLRVAPGQESMRDIKLLGAIFQRTEEILTHVLRRRWNRGEISLA
jgi:hypothetical protein